MMKNLIFFTILSFVFWAQGVSGQTGANPNTIPPSRDCVQFRYVCTGANAVHPGARVDYVCTWGSLIGLNTYVLPAPFYEYCRQCPENYSESICYRYRNWHLCSLSGSFSSNIYQTLSNLIYINDQLIGLGAGVGSIGGLAACIGRVFAGPLNNIHSRTRLNICPGEQAILRLTNLEIPEASGLCLTVRIKNANNQTLNSSVYTHNHVIGSEVDITAQLANLQPATTYIIEMELRCCGESPSCTINTFKSAFFELRGPLVYDVFLRQGGAGTNCDFLGVNAGTDFPGPKFLTPVQFNLEDLEISRICPITINVANVQNPDNSNLTVVLNRIQNCDIHQARQQLWTQNIVIPTGGIWQGSLINQFSDDCRCYEVVMSYQGCNNTLQTDRYYFRAGDNCTGLRDDDEVFLKSSINPQDVRILPNPVTDALTLDLQDAIFAKGELMRFSIFDLYGRAVHIAEFPALQGQIQQHVGDLKSGTYIYVVEYGDLRNSGKFVKM